MAAWTHRQENRWAGGRADGPTDRCMNAQGPIWWQLVWPVESRLKTDATYVKLFQVSEETCRALGADDRFVLLLQVGARGTSYTMH